MAKRSNILEQSSPEEIQTTMSTKTTQLDDKQLKIYRAVKAWERKNGQKFNYEAVSAPVVKAVPKVISVDSIEIEPEETRTYKKRWPHYYEVPKEIDKRTLLNKGVFVKTDKKVEVAMIRGSVEDDYPVFVSDSGKRFKGCWENAWRGVKFACILQPGVYDDPVHCR